MADGIDALAQKLVMLTDPAIVTAIEAAHAQAVASIISGVVWLCIGGLSVAISRQAWKRIEPGDMHDWPWTTRGVVTTLFALFGAVLIVWNVGVLCDPWDYITLQHPELWLAKIALKL